MYLSPGLSASLNPLHTDRIFLSLVLVTQDVLDTKKSVESTHFINYLGQLLSRNFAWYRYYPAWQAFKGEGKGKDKRAKRGRIKLLILTSLPFYGLPRRQHVWSVTRLKRWNAIWVYFIWFKKTLVSNRLLDFTVYLSFHIGTYILS